MTSTVHSQGSGSGAMTWSQLQTLCEGFSLPDRVTGPTNSQSVLRTFGQDPSTIRVTLFRDHHAWCPYCQKVWLFLEEKKIPYRIRKVTMFCYGEKEAWYKRICPRGMLPAVTLDGQLITESDDILIALENEFGPLYKPMSDRKEVVPLRQLERYLFRAWCGWLCYPARSSSHEQKNRRVFISSAQAVDQALASTEGPYFLDQFSVVDCFFTPYVERMSASLFYYKGFTLRDPSTFPHISRWFDAMEARETYRGTQSDFHTHVHDLPPQMGGCYESNDPQQLACKARVDIGTDMKLPDVGFPQPEDAKMEALTRVLKHKDYMLASNPNSSASSDIALRCALTNMMTGSSVCPPSGTDFALRYIRDRVNVPRDMSLWSARCFRTSLEQTAALTGNTQGPEIPTRHRRDQNPRNFGK